MKFANGIVYVASRLVVDAERTFSPGALVVSEGVVLQSGPKDDILRSLPASFSVREFPGQVILPGLVNAHTHLHIPRHLGNDAESFKMPESFVDWLLQVVAWRLQPDPPPFPDILRSSVEEALSFGTTSIGEIASSDLSAYASFPLRGRVFAEGIGFYPEAAPVIQEIVREAIARLGGISAANPLVVPGVAPHTLYTVSAELLRSLGALSVTKRVPVCLHLAESRTEIEFLENGGGEIASRLYPSIGQDVSWFHGIGRSIPIYLAEAGLLHDGILLVHNVHLSRVTIDTLRQGGARFVLCPRSNQAHGNGTPDITHFVDARIPFALGTDSLGSVGTLSLWDEIRAARSLYNGKKNEGELCRDLMQAATINGSMALGLPGGALTNGSPSDFIVVDDPGDGGGFCRKLVEQTERENVRLTFVAGRAVHGEAS